jgi:hypothetical protein
MQKVGVSSGPDLVAKAAIPLIPKERKDFPLFYFPPKSNTKEMISKISTILKNSKTQGLLLIIGSDDPTQLPEVVRGAFSKAGEGQFKGARFILVGLKEQRDELVKFVESTGAVCDFATLGAQEEK